MPYLDRHYVQSDLSRPQRQIRLTQAHVISHYTGPHGCCTAGGKQGGRSGDELSGFVCRRR